MFLYFVDVMDIFYFLSCIVTSILCFGFTGAYASLVVNKLWFDVAGSDFIDDLTRKHFLLHNLREYFNN